MRARELPWAVAQQWIALAHGNRIPPPEIVALKERIAAEERAASSGTVGQEQRQKIANMKLELEELYIRWAEQELINELLKS